MIAAQDEEMMIASRTLYNKNQDEVARLWAEAREPSRVSEQSEHNCAPDTKVYTQQSASCQRWKMAGIA